MLGNQADYKSNREVFAKEYMSLVEAERNETLCTYVYISLDMCKELLLWQRAASFHGENTEEHVSSMAMGNLYQM